MHHFRLMQLQRIKVNDIEVGLHARHDGATIVQAVKGRRAAGLGGNGFFKAEAGPARAVAYPVR